jgi:hypothetical protein
MEDWHTGTLGVGMSALAVFHHLSIPLSQWIPGVLQ